MMMFYDSRSRKVRLNLKLIDVGLSRVVIHYEITETHTNDN